VKRTIKEMHKEHTQKPMLAPKTASMKSVRARSKLGMNEYANMLS
jgi:hypothetical protein